MRHGGAPRPERPEDIAEALECAEPAPEVTDAA
jgi:hypothetical protein